MSMSPPSWHPDPSGAPQLRWWDGQQWTEHVHALPDAAQVPASANTASAEHTASTENSASADPAPKRRKRKGLIIGLVAGAAVLALIITVSVVAVRSFLPTVFGLPLPTEAGEVEGRDYLMTEPMLEMHHQTKFTFPAPYDFAQRFPDSLDLDGAERTEDQARLSDAFELFLDASLTARADLSVYQDEAGADLSIQPNEASWINTGLGGEQIDVMPQSWGAYFNWGMEDEYYLVRHIDERGEKLSTPVVTKLTTEEPDLASPHVTADRVTETGAVKLSWDEVAGATEYIVIGSHNVTTEDDDYRWYFAYGTTTDTTWTSEKDLDEFDPHSRQNASMALFDGQSADQLMSEGERDADDQFIYEKGEFRWGVIATDGTNFSKAGTIDAAGVVGSLPYEVAKFEMNLGMYTGPVDPARLPQRFAFTGLDGRTRATQAYIAEGDITGDGTGSWEIHISGVGTMLKAEASWYMTSTEAAQAPSAEEFRAAYNAGAANAYSPTTGLGDFEVLSGTLEEVAETSKAMAESADIAYPVYGSDEFVEFLAGHFVAGTELIDITAFAEAPGAQSVWDAINEAYYQNPYIVGLDRENFGESRSGSRWVIRAAYTMDASERGRIQQSISDSVDAVVASVVSDGMTDADIAVALNDWVTGNAEYDYPAFETIGAGGVSPEYEYAWRADGVFEYGSVVCGGYAIAYSALMNAAGIETVVVTGDVLSGGRHAWNKVRIDDQWLAVDVTWNDSPQPNSYLLIGDGGFVGDATRTEDVYWVRDDLVDAFTTP